MNRITNYLLVVFLSPEILIVLAVFGINQLYPDALLSLGDKIKADKEVWRFLPTLTLGLSVVAFKQSSKLRAPLENKSNKVLYEWPLYHLLVDRVMVSLAFATICGFLSLVLWIFGNDLTSSFVGPVFIGATTGAAATAFTMLLAHQKLRELLEKYGE